MDKEYTRTWHTMREQGLAWLDWIGGPMLYDAGLYVNRTKEEHDMSRIYFK